MKNRSPLTLTVSLLALTALGAGIFGVLKTSGPTAGRAEAATNAIHAAPRTEAYPYGGPAFTVFVADSYRVNHAGDPQAFTRWLETAYAKNHQRAFGESAADLPHFLAAQKARLKSINDPSKRAEAQAETAAQLHRFVKLSIPKFDLDRGFEFVNAVSLGERQCFLQSVLIAGLLQAMDVDAGVVMVNKSISGAESNNGHAVCVVKLNGGNDILVDASEPEPFARQLGLFTYDSDSRLYKYVEPVYSGGDAHIASYALKSDGRKVSPSRLRTLDTRFLRSMFDYYRGERAVGGLLVGAKNPVGLKASEALLRTSSRECPQNPLPLYLLGRVHMELKRPDLARAELDSAHRIYADAGWVPQNWKNAYGEVASLR